MKDRLSLFIQKVIVVAVLVLLLLALVKVSKLMLTVFAGMLLAVVWRGLARGLSDHTPISYSLAVPLVILLNVGAIVLFFVFAAPNLAEGIEEIVEKAPEIGRQLETQLRDTRLGSMVLDSFQDRHDNLADSFLRWGQLVTLVTTTLDVLLDTLLILIFGLFFISDPKMYVRGILHLVPIARRERIHQVLHCVEYTLFRWFIGQLIDMASIFVMTAIGLWLLGMPLVFTFALIAFLFSFVPNIGPLLSVIPPVAFALLISPSQALYVAGLYLGIQLFESYFITPNVQKKASFTPPVLLLFAQFFLGAVAGILGLFLATPLLVTAIVLTKMLYVEDYLGDEEVYTCEDRSPAPLPSDMK